MKRQLWFLAAAAVLCCTRADASLTHRYSFNDGTANDSVGSANGTVVGSNGSVSGGQLVLANTGEGSQNPGAAGAFLNLPNGLISSSSASGTSGAVTVEMWLTMSQNRDWSAAFSAGISVGGEDQALCCNDDQPYIQIIPRTGDGGQGNDLRVTTNTFGGPESWVDDQGAGNGTDLQVGVEEHVVAVFNQSGGLPGSFEVFRNGASMGVAPVAANLDLNTFLRADNTGGDVNVWVGRSQWGDALMAGSVNELRIYDGALSANQVAANFALGPNQIPEPATIALAVAAACGLIVRRKLA